MSDLAGGLLLNASGAFHHDQAPQVGAGLVVVHALQVFRVRQHPTVPVFNAPVALFDSLEEVMRTIPKGRAAFLCEHFSHLVVQLRVVLFEGQQIVHLLLYHLPANAFLIPAPRVRAAEIIEDKDLVIVVGGYAVQAGILRHAVQEERARGCHVGVHGVGAAGGPGESSATRVIAAAGGSGRACRIGESPEFP